MTAISGPPQITARHRLELTLFVAAALHVVIILGVGFGVDPPSPRDEVQRMEITLVNPRNDTVPDKARYLAQSSQEGGGEDDTPARPTSPASTPAPLPSRGAAPFTQPTRPAAPRQRATQQLLTTPRERPRQATAERDTPPAPELPDAAQLMRRSLEMASLSAEINRNWQASAEKPRQKFISASTRAYKYAAYEESWRLKVERIGNLNYPDEAKRRRLSGALMLDVALNPDGSLNSIRVLRSSGSQLLDDAARRIVHLAAPFAPFPPNIRSETDILHIIRTWKFDSEYRLSSR